MRGGESLSRQFMNSSRVSAMKTILGKGDEPPSDEEKREADVLKRLLSTPPDHRRKEKSKAGQKKPGKQLKGQTDAAR